MNDFVKVKLCINHSNRKIMLVFVIYIITLCTLYITEVATMIITTFLDVSSSKA